MGDRKSRPRRPERRRSAGGAAAACLAILAAAAASCTNEQVVSVEVATVRVAPPTASTIEGEQLQLTATVLDENAVPLEGATVVWTSRDTSVVSVDADGTVRARGDGVTTVRAAFRDAWGESTVRVLPGPEIVLSRDSVAVFAGRSGEAPESEAVQVTNGGGATLEGVSASVRYPPEAPSGWLEAALDRTTLPATLTLTAAPGDLPAGTYRSTVVLSAPAAQNSPVTLPVTLSLTGFSVRESGAGTSVAETGTDDTFIVVLDLRPAEDVVLTVESGSPDEVAVSPATLRFEPDRWSTPQTVTVRGVDDDEVDGARKSSVTVAVDEDRSDELFGGLDDVVVRVTNEDDDAAGISVVESGGGTAVDESGSTDGLTVRLTARPATPVTIGVRSADLGEARVEPAAVTFTADSWDAPVTVTVTGVDDASIDGTQETDVTFSVDAAESDDTFDEATDRVVAVDTRDDDEAGISLGESGDATAVTESGGTDAVTVVLTARPTANVVVTVASADPEEMTVAPAALTFTPENWDAPQTLTVRGADDPVADGDQVTALVVSVDDAASDDAFDGLSDQSVDVATTDDDGASLVVSESGGTAVTESGGSDAFTVRLASQPLSDVVVDVVSDDPGEATASPAGLTFTPVDWASSQTVTVAGVDDPVADGPQATVLTVTVRDAESDPAYRGVEDVLVEVTTSDDDVPGFTVTQSGATIVDEAGGTDDITIVLTAQPVSNVVLSIASGDTGETVPQPTALVFTPADWNAAKAVTVTGVDDPTVDGNQVAALTISVDDAGSDGAYDNVASQNVDVTVVDDDVAGLSVTESGGSTIVTESGGRDDVTVMLAAQPLGDVVLTISVSDASEATASPLTLTFTSVTWSTPQTITVTGVDDLLLDGDRTSTLRIAVDDAASHDAFDGVADRTVTVTTRDNFILSGRGAAAATGS